MTTGEIIFWTFIAVFSLVVFVQSVRRNLKKYERQYGEKDQD